MLLPQFKRIQSVFQLSGRHEGSRKPTTERAEPSLAGGKAARDLSFDENWYLAAYPDVAEAVASGAIRSGQEHYGAFGCFEGRHPSFIAASQSRLATLDLLSERVHVERCNLRTEGSSYRSTANDPQIVFKPEMPIEPGWYRLVIDMETSAANARPQVFFDFGGGFSELFSVRAKRLGRARFTAMLKLPFPAPVIRLDPIDGRGTLQLERFDFEPLSVLGTGLGLAAHAVRLFTQDPPAFISRMPELWKAVREPRFIQMRDRLPDKRGGSDYTSWIRKYDFDPARDGQRLRTEVNALDPRPLISVLMPVYNTPQKLLDDAIGSVVNQIYPNWELCIADDRSSASHVRRSLEKWQRSDVRIKVVYRSENGHISHATNSAFALASGEWIALLDHDDILREHALAEVAFEIARHPQAQLVYSDEDKLGAKGRRYDPYFKPDFSRELFRSQNYLNHLTVHRADNIRAVGGWRPGFEGSQDYDLNLRIFERIDSKQIRHIPKVLYHWRAAEGSTATAGSEKSYAYAAGLRALQDHVDRTGVAASVEAAPDTPFYRIRMQLPDPAPLVSLIVPTRDKVELLRGCIESIRARTTYANYEILIVDNGSAEPETLIYLKSLKGIKNVRVLRYDKPFNYSAINNFAAAKAKGEIIGLINNDIEVISPGWLTEMVSWAVQPDVGCVGAKLYYANSTIQHAGVIVGLGGVAGHSHKHFPRDHPGYFFRLKVLQNLSAVTGACLLVKKSVYEQVGGLDEEHLKVAFNDVDFCLKVRAASYLNVWTPYAELYHLESVSRGPEDDPEKIARFALEVQQMKRRWLTERNFDAFYSKNLSKSTEDFAINH